MSHTSQNAAIPAGDFPPEEFGESFVNSSAISEPLSEEIADFPPVAESILSEDCPAGIAGQNVKSKVPS